MASDEPGEGLIYHKKRPWDEGKDETRLPQYGNYRHYYSIRREGIEGARRSDAERQADPRLNVILEWLKSEEAGVISKEIEIKRVLDVGCNNGQFTLELCNALQLKVETVIGVDLDRDLVLLAARRARGMGLSTLREESTAAVEASFPTPLIPRVLGSGRARGRTAAAPKQRLRLDAAPAPTPFVVRFLQCEWVFNDQLNSQRGESRPSNMTRMQWLDMAEVDREDKLGYQLILAASVTKWIHIHHSDIGLRRFFARVVDCLAAGGIFIMEPQGYKSYKHSLKVLVRGSQAHRNFAALRAMPDDFAWILTHELGLEGPFQIRANGKVASVRQIDAYIQPPLDHIPQHCLERRAALLALPSGEVDQHIPWVPRSREACI